MTAFDWDDDTTLREAVLETIGAASMCWENIEEAGVFKEQRAIELADQLIEFINGEFINRQIRDAMAAGARGIIGAGE